MKELPIYILNGFLDSGKTSFLKDTLDNEEFSQGQNILLIVCEEGEEEYEADLLNQYNIHLEIVDGKENFTVDFFKEKERLYNPDCILLEYNGMWQLKDFMTMKMPRHYVIVQIITLVNSSTFELYLNNMRSLIMEQFKTSDMVIFNRCHEETPKSSYRRTVKAVNSSVQIFFENADGSEAKAEDILPFDLEEDIIQIEEEDFGIWYVDTLDSPEKYKGKTVNVKGQAFKSSHDPQGCFALFRSAMTCCIDDIASIGFPIRCSSKDMQIFNHLKSGQWIQVTAKIDLGPGGLMLLAEEIIPCEKAAQELVYFN